MAAIALAVGCLFLLSRCDTTTPSSDSAAALRVAVPVTDLRSRPSLPRRHYGHDRRQESQILYGESVVVKGRRGGWSEVEATEQPEWSHHKRWEGYPGWVRSSHLIRSEGWTPNLTITGKHAIVLARPDPAAEVILTLSLGSRIAGVEPLVTKGDGWQEVRLLDGRNGWMPRSLAAPTADLQRLDAATLRHRLLDAARLLLGDPYYWGGRSATPHPMLLVVPTVRSMMAVDCSGLVNLCHRAVGIDLPRDAHEQFLRCRRLNKEELKPGDLIFLSKPGDPQQITHVMLYAGGDEVIEAPATGLTVRQIALRQRLGFTLKGLREDRPTAEDRYVRFGTYLP